MLYQVQLDNAVGSEAYDTLGIIACNLETVHPDPELLVRRADLMDRLADVRKRDTPLVAGREPVVLVHGIELQAPDRDGRPSRPGDGHPFLESVGIPDLDPEGVPVDRCHQATVKSLVHGRHYMKSEISRE